MLLALYASAADIFVRSCWYRKKNSTGGTAHLNIFTYYTYIQVAVVWECSSLHEHLWLMWWGWHQRTCMNICIPMIDGDYSNVVELENNTSSTQGVHAHNKIDQANDDDWLKEVVMRARRWYGSGWYSASKRDCRGLGISNVYVGWDVSACTPPNHLIMAFQAFFCATSAYVFCLD